MLATKAGTGGRNLSQRPLKFPRNPSHISTASPKDRQRTFLFARHEVRRSSSIDPVKQDQAAQSRPLHSFDSFQSMFRNQELVCPFVSKHLDANQLRSYDNCMQPISADSINLLEPRERTAIYSNEAAKGAEVLHCSSGLHTSDHVPSSLYLPFNRNRRLTVDARLSQAL